MRLNDNNTRAVNSTTGEGLAIYICIRLLPVVAFLMYPFLKLPIMIIVFTIVLIAEFWVVKSISGIQLIGLRWYFDKKTTNQRSFQFYSKPDPYVPNTLDSNIFWSLFFVCLFGWSITAIIEFFILNYIKSLLAIIAVLFQSVNLYMYSKARNMAKKAIQKSVLDALQEEMVKFPKIDEDKFNSDITYSSSLEEDIQTDDKQEEIQNFDDNLEGDIPKELEEA